MDRLNFIEFIIYNSTVLAVFATLAIYFEKWWISLFALLFSLTIRVTRSDDDE